MQARATSYAMFALSLKRHPFFEEMHALGGGGSCLGTAPKTELVARATFYTIFALSMKRRTRSGVEAHAWALLASMHCMKTHNETHTGRRACGQRPEWKPELRFMQCLPLL